MEALVSAFRAQQQQQEQIQAQTAVADTFQHQQQEQPQASQQLQSPTTDYLPNFIDESAFTLSPLYLDYTDPFFPDVM